MNFILTFFLFILGLFPSLFLSDARNVAETSADLERKNDIDSIHMQLEIHYNDNGEYPTLKEFENDFDITLPGLSEDQMTDPEGVLANRAGSDYLYRPDVCSAIGCATYTLTSRLENGDSYEKRALN